MKHRFTDYHVTLPWVGIWSVVFALILVLSVIWPTGNMVTIVKLGGIALCLFYVVRTFPKDHLLVAAMLATSIADILLANDNISEIGVLVFLVTQLLHLARLGGAPLRWLVIIYGVVAVLAVVVDFAVIRGGSPVFVPPLYLAAGLYAATLITNIVVSAQWYLRVPTSLQARLALAGFILFGCCDFCTALSYASLIGVLPWFMYAPANFFVWMFYYPSQILIANTGAVTKGGSREIRRNGSA